MAADRLPPITEKWAHFEGVAQDPGAARDRGDRSSDRLAGFDRLLAALGPLRPRVLPPLYFLPLLLPPGPEHPLKDFVSFATAAEAAEAGFHAKRAAAAPGDAKSPPQRLRSHS